jgi:hypothetical protein
MPDSSRAATSTAPKPSSRRHDYVVRCELHGGFRGDGLFRLAVNDCLSEKAAREAAQKVLDRQRPLFPWLITQVEDLGPTTHKENR